ncbi:hypothetical protein D5086_009230 [Populus alba]|uniref:Uncharacterized protein n=1 Tax=Populus alba TaxID=43335 RepID=A0ACC4CHQ8_POPAL
MESRAMRIDDFDMKTNASTLRRKGKSLLNGESSSQMRGEEGVPEGQASQTWSSLSGDENRVSVPTEILRYEEDFPEGQSRSSFESLNREEYQVPAPTESLWHEEFQHDDSLFSDQHSLKRIQRRLEEGRGIERHRGRSSSTCIFPFPHSFDKINPNTYRPELVSLGPYHRGKDHVLEFEDYKWFFLDKLLSRSRTDLSDYLGALKFNERDLLKFENQLPYFLLHLIFNLSGGNGDIKPEPDLLPILALKAIDLVFPRRAEILNKFGSWHEGIITRFSQNDQYVADLFNTLGKNVAFNIRECYLSKIFREVESYYSSNWATMRRTYFSSPWSFISVLSASILLVLTMLQSIMSVLSYKCH